MSMLNISRAACGERQELLGFPTRWWEGKIGERWENWHLLSYPLADGFEFYKIGGSRAEQPKMAGQWSKHPALRQLQPAQEITSNPS